MMTDNSRPGRRLVLGVAMATAAGILMSACGSGDSSSSSTEASGAPEAVRIGYFPNLTHAPALIADKEGYFTRRLGQVKTQSFNAGPDVIQALFSDSLDISYIGPNPTITAYAQSQGQAIRVIAGAASGGASLVVRDGISSPADLKGKKIATPQLGNTQDIALRHWLRGQKLAADTEGGGDVGVVPQKNATALQSFVSGQIDGAWVPEPFATLFQEKGAKVLVDETTLWPDGKFVTTNVVVRTEFLREHPDKVAAFLEAHLDAVDLTRDDPAKAQAAVIGQIKALTGQDTDPGAVEKAWKNLTFTADPLSATLKTSAEHAAAVGLLDNQPSDGFSGLWDLAPLNTALTARNQPEVTS